MEQIKNTKTLINKHYHADYICGCGKVFNTRIYSIISGHTKSCGCRKIKRNGNSDTRIYNIFYNMKSRCYSKTDTGYKWYGAKGVEICDEWIDNPSSFEKWSLENGYRDDLSIDRKDNNGDYSPSNCRWATNSIQARNKRMLDSNTSGYIGVSRDTRYKASYRAYVNINNKHIHIGTFKNLKDAAIARNDYIDNNKTGHTKNEV